jgi:hypothetical protein
MTTIARAGFVSHLRAEPNEFILHFRGGKLTRRGASLAYWFPAGSHRHAARP